MKHSDTAKWLSTRKLLQGIDNDCIKDLHLLHTIIEKSYVNDKQFLFKLIDNSSEEQMDSIYQTLKHAVTNCDQSSSPSKLITHEKLCKELNENYIKSIDRKDFVDKIIEKYTSICFTNSFINFKFSLLILFRMIGNTKQFLFSLIKNAQNQQFLDIIYELLNEEKEKIKISALKQCYFNKLSLESITNICSYLNKEDIGFFKLTSSSIGIQCLLEMKKYTHIGTINMNNTNHYYPLYLKSSYSFERYTESTINNENKLLNIWSNKYNIPLHHIMLLKTIISEKNKNQSTIIMPQTTSTPFLSSVVYQQYFLIFDKRAVPIIDVNGNNMDIQDIDNGIHTMILLNYYNESTKTNQFVTSIIVEKDITVERLEFYIKKKEIFAQFRVNKNDRLKICRYSDGGNKWVFFKLWDTIQLHDTFTIRFVSHPFSDEYYESLLNGKKHEFNSINLSHARPTNIYELANIVAITFEQKYNQQISSEIAQNILKFYPENGFDWEDICDDFEESSCEDCFGLDEVIDTLKKYQVYVQTWSKRKTLYLLLRKVRPIR